MTSWHRKGGIAFPRNLRYDKQSDGCAGVNASVEDGQDFYTSEMKLDFSIRLGWHMVPANSDAPAAASSPVEGLLTVARLGAS